MKQILSDLMALFYPLEEDKKSYTWGEMAFFYVVIIFVLLIGTIGYAW